jgi:hypothetical protein
MLLLALEAQTVHAETVYVVEQLVVSIARLPGGEGDRVATVKSGDSLDVLERQNDEAHVKLSNGSEGWIKTSYLSSEQPLQRRLSDRTAEAEKLRADVTRLESELATARSGRDPAVRSPSAGVATDARTNSAASTARTSAGSASGTPDSLTSGTSASSTAGANGSPTFPDAPGSDDATATSANAPIRDAPSFLATPEIPGRPLWEWLLGTAAAMLLLGFALGWRTLDRRIRRKFGGVRIY